jgi:hypothetical protein
MKYIQRFLLCSVFLWTQLREHNLHLFIKKTCRCCVFSLSLSSILLVWSRLGMNLWISKKVNSCICVYINFDICSISIHIRLIGCVPCIFVFASFSVVVVSLFLNKWHWISTYTGYWSIMPNEHDNYVDNCTCIAAEIMLCCMLCLISWLGFCIVFEYFDWILFCHDPIHMHSCLFQLAMSSDTWNGC